VSTRATLCLADLASGARKVTPPVWTRAGLHGVSQKVLAGIARGTKVANRGLMNTLRGIRATCLGAVLFCACSSQTHESDSGGSGGQRPDRATGGSGDQKPAASAGQGATVGQPDASAGQGASGGQPDASAGEGGAGGGGQNAGGSDPTVDPPNPGSIPNVPSVVDTGTSVSVSEPPGLDTLSQEIDTARQTTPDELRASHAPEFETDLGYDPLTAANLDQILTGLRVQSAAAAKEALAKTGFALPTHAQTSSFALGYSQIYAADLPVFVSADMVLEAVYRSHDKILQLLEKQTLKPNLQTLLSSLRASLFENAGSLEPDVASDLNL
jgi:hypothetical protein